MKKLIIVSCCSLLFALLLISCGPSQEQLAATATWQVYNQQVATIIAGTKAARAALPTNTSTPTPPPLALEEALLTQDEVYAILTWEEEVNVEDFADADTFNFYHVYDFCIYNCIDRFWINGNWQSHLGILLSRYPTDKTAEEAFDEYFIPDTLAKPHTEYPSLASYVLPEKSVVYHDDEYAILAGRQGRVIFAVILHLPDQTSEQQLFYLGQFSERQLIKLIAFGN